MPRKDPEEARKWKREWWAKNAHRKKKYNSKFRKTCVATVRAANAAYRARKIGATPPISADERRKIRLLYEKARRLTRSTGVAHHVDHIHPLKHPLFCGLHVYANLQIIPATLNIKKQNYIPLDILDGIYVNTEHHDD